MEAELCAGRGGQIEGGYAAQVVGTYCASSVVGQQDQVHPLRYYSEIGVRHGSTRTRWDGDSGASDPRLGAGERPGPIVPIPTRVHPPFPPRLEQTKIIQQILRLKNASSIRLNENVTVSAPSASQILRTAYITGANSGDNRAEFEK